VTNGEGHVSTGTTMARVDQSAIKVSQAAMVAVLLIAFIADFWPLVAFVAIVNLVGVLSPDLFLWRLLYLHVLKPLGWVKPHVIPDYHEPHRFARAVGGVLAAASATLLALGFQLAGWVLTWVLILLASLNLLVGFCLGCFTYYQLSKLGVPGFHRSQPRRSPDA
jgi:hypothetical protein